MAEVTFDEFCKIRLLRQDKYDTSLELKEESKEYLNKMKEFTSIVEEILREKARKGLQIEAEKRKAIGKRLLYEEKLSTNRKWEIVVDKHSEVVRLKAQKEALEAVVLDQERLLDFLNNK